jgi:hypothetical protein
MADITDLACEIIRMKGLEDHPDFLWWIEKQKEKEKSKNG